MNNFSKNSKKSIAKLAALLAAGSMFAAYSLPLSFVSADDTSRPPEDTSRPPEDTSRPPEDTSRPPEDTSRPPEDTSRPPEDTSRPPEDTSRPPEGTLTKKQIVDSFQVFENKLKGIHEKSLKILNDKKLTTKEKKESIKQLKKELAELKEQNPDLAKLANVKKLITKISRIQEKIYTRDQVNKILQETADDIQDSIDKIKRNKVEINGKSEEEAVNKYREMYREADDFLRGIHNNHENDPGKWNLHHGISAQRKAELDRNAKTEADKILAGI
ncbi:hypothetical protein [Pasteuria penetrans]|uniref:hypothetical protein n=1 Tax=Pasteuria penetrans TaxID=86005 RepID=UPI0011EE244F|nr:hypothetical protein [Pasteuria penetrans]